MKTSAIGLQGHCAPKFARVRGGSFGFADPVADIAFAYTMNRMSDQFELDPRRRGLADAVYAAL